MSELTDFWAAVDERIDRRFQPQLRQALLNHRPGGNTTVQVILGQKGAPLLADPTREESHNNVDFPCRLQKIELRATDAGTGTFDLWIQYPGQDLAAARGQSLLGVGKAVLDDGAGGAATSATVLPASDWVRMIPAGSTLLPVVLSAAGLTLATLNVVVFCYPGVPWGAT